MPTPAAAEDSPASTADIASADVDDLVQRLDGSDRQIRLMAWTFGLLGCTGSIADLFWLQPLFDAMSAWPRFPLEGLAAGVRLAGPTCLFVAVAIRARRSLDRHTYAARGDGGRGRGKPAVLSTAVRPQGFGTAVSLGAAATAVGVLTLTGGLIRVDRGNFWAEALVAAVPLVVAWLLIHRGPRVLLLPDRLVVRRIRTRDAPWSQIASATHRPGAGAGAGAAELTVLVDRPHRDDALRIALRWLEVNPRFLADLIVHYVREPQDRTAIGSVSELARRRADFDRADIDRADIDRGDAVQA